VIPARRADSIGRIRTKRILAQQREFVVRTGFPKPIGRCLCVVAELFFALAQCSLGALAFGHIDVGTENLDNLSARGEPMMGGYVEIFDCSIRQYDSELARVVSFLAHCLLDLFPYPASIVWVDPLPHSIAARKTCSGSTPQMR